ncbi:hypothetical protein DsansV1_C10g0103311 [Dioscorea sansibarensis]
MCDVKNFQNHPKIWPTTHQIGISYKPLLMSNHKSKMSSPQNLDISYYLLSEISRSYKKRFSFI